VAGGPLGWELSPGVIAGAASCSGQRGAESCRFSRRPELDSIIRMSGGDPRDQILRLEAGIEDLTELIGRCRKIILISKIAVAAAGIWLLALTIGITRFDPVAMIGAIAVVIGGTVVLGSRHSHNEIAAGFHRGGTGNLLWHSRTRHCTGRCQIGPQ
jgi:hypothetical protein